MSTSGSEPDAVMIIARAIGIIRLPKAFVILFYSVTENNAEATYCESGTAATARVVSWPSGHYH